MDSSSNNSNSSNNDHIIITMNKSTSSDNIVDSNDRNNSIMSPAEIVPNSGSAKRAAEATATLYRVAARNLRESQGVNSMTAPMLEKIMTLLHLEPRRLVVRGLAPRRLLLGASPAPLPTMEDSPDVEENERYEERGMFEDDIENDTSEAEQIDADEREKEDASGDGNDDTLEKEDETQEEPKPKPKPESRRPIHAALVTGGIKLRPRETKALLRALDVSPLRFVRLGLVDGKALRAVDDIGGPSQGPPHGPHHLCPGHPPGMGKHGHGSRFGRNIGHSGPPPHGRHHSGRHVHLPSSDGEGGHGRPMHGPPRHHDPPRGRHGGGRRGHSGPPPHGRHHSGRHLHHSGSDSEGECGRPMHGPPRHHGSPRDRHGGGRRGHSGPPPHGRHHSGRHLHQSGSDSEGECGRPMHGPPRHHGPPRGRHGGGRRGHSGPPPHGRHHSDRHLHQPGSGSEGECGRPMHGPPRHHDPPRGRHGGGRRGHSGPPPHGRHHSGRHLHHSGSDFEGECGRPMHGPPRHHGSPRDRHGGGRRGHSGPPPPGRHHSGRHLHQSGSDSEGEYGRPMHGPPRHHGPPRGRHGGGRRGEHSGPPPHGRHHSGRHLHLPSSDCEGDRGRPMHGPTRHHDPPRGRYDGTRRGKHPVPPPHDRHHSGRHLHLSNRAREGGAREADGHVPPWLWCGSESPSLASAATSAAAGGLLRECGEQGEGKGCRDQATE